MPRRRKRSPIQIAILLVLSLVIYGGKQWLGVEDQPAREGQSAPNSGGSTRESADHIQSVIRNAQSGTMVESPATVTKILPDDNDGARHQRFIVQIPSGETLLIAHNIDLAQRVPVEVDDSVDFHGQFEANERGGVIHWTHHDPGGRREGGWIRHRGKIYK